MSRGCTLLDHAFVRVNVARLRDELTSLGDFRRVLADLTMVLGLEAARDLEVRETRVRTPLAECAGHEFARPLVIMPILRAGLGMAEVLVRIFPEARVGHIGLARDEVTFEPRSYYFKSPPLSGAEVFAVDPMLATGQSAADAVAKLKAQGGERIRLLSIIGAQAGLDHFQARHPDVPVFLAALDPRLNEKAYIVPGLGDAGDRYFGT